MDVIDLYAGAGGWSLGLALAGHRSVFSGEIWSTANRARGWNLGGEAPRVDVRALDPHALPDCDFLVGSPPCTQFSYANKGGNGDLVDGLRDVRAFLDAVRAKNPRYWVMENVPRLCGILERELAPGGALEEYADFFASIDDFDMSEWGVPQRRRRCIAGNYPREALLALRGRIRPPTLEQVLEGCARGIDPVWGGIHAVVTDNEPGDVLSWEEARINAEKKTNHPIYNDMSFPDALGRPARTVTATCTKVSRESIVVAAGGGHRLLSVRESAAIQSFPLSYQFPATGRSDRITMAGNAIPPLFTYMLGLVVAGRDLPDVLPSFEPASGMAPPAAVDRKRPARVVQDRGFRAAIDALRFKSGMSFELRNGFDASGTVSWSIRFNLGKIDDTHRFLDPDGIARVVTEAGLSPVGARVAVPDGLDIQRAWVESRDCEWHPYRICDGIGVVAASLASSIPEETAIAATKLAFRATGVEPTAKGLRHSAVIAAGLVLAAAFNAQAASAEMSEAA